jgi:hypothetical protein
MYLARASSDIWGVDLLGAEMFMPGTIFRYVVEDGDFDLRLVDDRGRECVSRGVHIYGAAQIRITDKGLLTCEFPRGWEPDESMPEVAVRSRRPSGGERSERVRCGGLALGRGVDECYRRIVAAASRVCSGEDETTVRDLSWKVSLRRDRERCETQAVDRAVCDADSSGLMDLHRRRREGGAVGCSGR